MLLYGAMPHSAFCSGMLNWSESGTGWMTVRILFLLYDASAKAWISGVIAYLPEAKMLTRSEWGISVTAGDGRSGNGRRKERIVEGVRSGHSGADGLVVPPEPSAGTMLPGKVLPEVVSLGG